MEVEWLINDLWYEISFLPKRFKAWRKREVIGINRGRYVKFYDYTKRK